MTLWHRSVAVYIMFTHDLMFETVCSLSVFHVVPCNTKSAHVFLQALEGLNPEQLFLVVSHWDMLLCRGLGMLRQVMARNSR